MQTTGRNTVTLVLGGARSGKSHYAQQLGEARRHEWCLWPRRWRADDDEMQRKIELHRGSRPLHWQTVEEPLWVGGGYRPPRVRLRPDDHRLPDFLSPPTCSMRKGDEQSAIDALCMALTSPPCSVVLVSNEVGSGVVPAYTSGRRFRDLLGEMNQSVARVASNVLLLVAGLPLVLKGQLEVGSTEAVRTDAEVAK